jgi:hypothetical protein
MDQMQLAAMVELVQFGFLHLQQLSQLRCLWHKPDKLRVIKSILLEAAVAQLQEEHQQQVVVVWVAVAMPRLVMQQRVLRERKILAAAAVALDAANRLQLAPVVLEL